MREIVERTTCILYREVRKKKKAEETERKKERKKERKRERERERERRGRQFIIFYLIPQ